MIIRNLLTPGMMLGTPTNSTVSMIPNNSAGVVVTAKPGASDCFAEFTVSGTTGVPLTFRVDIWGLSGDPSTLRNGSILIAERSPWTTLGGSDATSGTAVVTFTPSKSFLVRLVCPDGGALRFTQPLLLPNSQYDATRQITGANYFGKDLMPLV